MSAIDDFSFSSDIIAAVNAHNATLLQTEYFEISISTAQIISIQTPVAVHVSSPTYAPSSAPSTSVAVNSSVRGNSDSQLTVIMAISLSILVLTELAYLKAGGLRLLDKLV